MNEAALRVVGCLLCQDELEAVKHHVLRAIPNVDDYIVIDNGSTDGTLEWLRGLSDHEPKIILTERSWNDSFADARNAYLKVVEERIAPNHVGPVLVAAADVDELHSDELQRDFRKIGLRAYYQDYNVVRVRSRSSETDWKGEPIWTRWDAWHKPMLIWEPGIHYEDRFGQFHETLKVPCWRQTELDDDGGRYYYHHVKRHGIIWLRALRNAFAGGGGPNLGTQCPWWLDFRTLVKDACGAETSDAFTTYLKSGGIDPRIKDFFREKRLLGTKFDGTPPLWEKWPDGTSEWREGWLAYFVYLHPKEMPLDLAERDREIGYMDYAQEVRTIHGPKSPAWAGWVTERAIQIV